MKPKEKAKELFKKYSKGKDEHGWFLCEFESCAKQCALIAVDELIKQERKTDDYYEIGSYWQEVKQEIELL